jgi:hypothetical protein
MAMISDAQISKYASLYGSLFNIEVTNGSAEDVKIAQAKDAGGYLAHKLNNSHINISSGILTVRKRSIDDTLIADLSFSIWIENFEEQFLEKVFDELIFFQQDPAKIPLDLRFIYLDKYLNEKNIGHLDLVKNISKRLDYPLSQVLTLQSNQATEETNYLFKNQIIEELKSYYDPIIPKNSGDVSLNDYITSIISDVKGKTLEVYTARLFKENIDDSVVFARKKYPVHWAEIRKSEDDQEKDIDVGVICSLDNFKDSLYDLMEKGYHIKYTYLEV